MDSATEDTAGRATIGAGQLHTPQEQRHDSFTEDNSKPEVPQQLTLVATLSPPTSPLEDAPSRFEPSASTRQPDPTLFTDDVSTEEQAPLFDSQSHQAESPAQEAQEESEQRGTERYTTVPGTTIQIENTTAGAVQYYRDRMAEVERLAAYRREVTRAREEAARLPWPPMNTSTGQRARDPESARQLAALARPRAIPSRTTPSRRRTPSEPEIEHEASSPQVPAPVSTPAPRPSRRRPRSESTAADEVASPRRRPRLEFEDAFPGDKPKNRRNGPSKKTASKEDDYKWRTLPNYEPPMDVLDQPGLTWNAKWEKNTTVFNPEDETDFDQLHPQEVKLVKILRLRPVQYLASKRRLFQEYVALKKEKKSLNKTLTQSALNIDVNKASQLFLAFEGIGWFNEKYFKEFLKDEE